MPYNEKLADRIRELIAEKEKNVEEKRMFSGMCFMVNDKMCICLGKGTIMVRLDPGISEQVLEQEGVSPMIMSGKAIKGFVRVNEEALTTKKKLHYWVDLALSYNKFAKSSKEKTSGKKPSSKKSPDPTASSRKKSSP
jgi:TfoX/Sxy family transcriptional regulator of competence genes